MPDLEVKVELVIKIHSLCGGLSRTFAVREKNVSLETSLFSMKSNVF